MRFHLSSRFLPAGIIWRTFLTIAALCLIPIAVHASPRAAAKSPTGTWKKCGRGVQLRLSAPVTSQGSLLLAELQSAKPLADLRADWGGQEVEFWRPDARAENRRALLGVDLERARGRYQFSVRAETGGVPVGCTAAVTVRAGKFATERLQVPPKYVEPNPEEIKRAEEERDRLRALFARVTPERLWQGRFRVPLDGVSAGGNFGRRRILNGRPGSPHSGMDFPAPAGTPVHAAQRGRVVLAEEFFFSGNTVVIDHGLGIYTFYGHLSFIRAKAGDLIEAGATLGESGATGRVTGPHLHWGLTVNRARVNPLEIVALLEKE
jgi:murein DD-endopeptidase MepM/ murein hydrolase activator NlpD